MQSGQDPDRGDPGGRAGRTAGRSGGGAEGRIAGRSGGGAEGLQAGRCDDRLDSLVAEIESCRACPRLVAWREQVAAERRAAFRAEEYWGRPVSGFGDRRAPIAVVGLAPAAHGANRTGRIFTGDRSGDWLFASMHRVGLANQPTSRSRQDGLRLKGVWVTAAVRCAPPANKPTPEERDRCLPYLRRELELVGPVRVVVVLGQFAYDVICRLLDVRPRPRFGHGVAVDTPAGLQVLCSYHPSQQNTFTGKLTEAMTDAVFERAAELAGLGAAAPASKQAGTGSEPRA